MRKIDYTKNPLIKYIEEDNKYQGNYFVYGEGGMGKSTSMLMLFNFFLDKAKSGENIVPIYIDSKGLDFTYEKPVFEYIIREYCGLNKDIINHTETLNDLLKNSDKKYYIIIDAINEAESNKYQVIRDIASLKEIFDKNYSGRIIVSSRTDENSIQFNEFKRIKMLDFTDKQIITFLTKYDFKNNGKTIAKIDIERINLNLLKILRVPMFLKIFKDVYKDEDVFPNLYKKNIIRESDLLSKFVDKIIEDKIDIHKAEISPEYLQCFFALKRFLPALAFELAKNDEFSISNENLHNLLIEKFNADYFCQFESLEEDYYENVGSLKNILKKCIDDFSFIICKGEKKNIEYSFAHQIWRDYFAAVYLENSIDYDVASGFEHHISDNIQQYVGEIIKEYEFENKTDVSSKMSPIEAFMQRNSNALSPLAVHLCIEIMKKSRNGKITARYDNLDLKYINFYDYDLQGSSFNHTKLYKHNFIPQGHTDRVQSVSFSPDGKRIVSGSRDKTIKIWDTKTGKQIGKTLKGHIAPVKSVCYSPDGKRIVSGGSGFYKAILIWDAETGRQIGVPFAGYTEWVNSVCYSPDGKRIASGSDDKTIRIWDAETGEQIGEPLLGHLEHVESVCYSSDGKRIASCSDDKTIRIWNAETGEQIREPLVGHTEWVISICYSPNGKRIVSGSLDKTIRIWDAETGKQIGKPFEGHESSVTSVCYSPDGKRIVSGSRDKTIRIWDAETGKQIGELLKGPADTVIDDVYSVCYSPDGKRIVGAKGHTIRIIDGRTGNLIGDSIEGNDSNASSISCSPDGKKIAIGYNDNKIRIRDTTTGLEIMEPLEGHSSLVGSVSFSPDGKKIVSCGFLERVIVWDIETGKQIESLTEDFSSVVSAFYSPNGERILAVNFDGTIQIWDTETGKLIENQLTKDANDIRGISYSPDGNRIVSGHGDKTIRIWDAETGIQLGKPLRGHTDRVDSVCFSPDGKRIVSGSTDETIRIWDAERGVQLGKTLRGHTDGVDSVFYSSDGQKIFSASYDGTVRIWNAKKGKQIGKFEDMRSEIKIPGMGNPYFLCKNKIICLNANDTMHIWDLETYLYTVLKGMIKSNIQNCNFENAVFNSEGINGFCNTLYCNGADVPEEYIPKPIPFEWNNEEDKESE